MLRHIRLNQPHVTFGAALAQTIWIHKEIDRIPELRREAYIAKANGDRMTAIRCLATIQRLMRIDV